MKNNAGPKALTSKNTHPKSLKILKSRTGGKLLDAPSGQGVFAQNWIREGGTAVALDRDPGQAPPGLPQIIADLNHRLPFRQHSFDAVSCIDGIEHLENPFELIREFHRVLKPDAVLLLCPTHLQSHMEPRLGKVEKEISEANLDFVCEYSGTLIIHDRNLEENKVMCFKRKV